MLQSIIGRFMFGVIPPPIRWIECGCDITDGKTIIKASVPKDWNEETISELFDFYVKDSTRLCIKTKKNSCLVKEIITFPVQEEIEKITCHDGMLKISLKNKKSNFNNPLHL